MKKKKIYICTLLSAALLCSACNGKKHQEQPASKTQAPPVQKTAESPEKEAYDIPKDTVTLNVYSQLSGYQGEQQGWFAQVLLDKFNVKLNFTNDGSEDFYSRQEKKGSLGDIIIWGTDSDQYHSAIEKGLLLDWEKTGC